MEAIASVLRPKFLPYTLVDAINDACDSLISIINVRRQQLIELIKVREQEMADIKTCKDRAHLEFYEADRLYEVSCSGPWYIPKKVQLPASFEAILLKSVFTKERRAYGEFKLSVKCDKDPFRTILNQITDVYLEVLNPEIMKYKHDTPPPKHEHGIIGIGIKGSSIGQYLSDIAYCNITEELFIIDRVYKRIVICNGAGQYIRHIDGRDVMRSPYSIAITPECMYIGTYDDKLFKYSRTTYQLLTQVNIVSGEYSSLAIHGNTNLYVGAMNNSRICIYSADLAFIQHFSHSLLTRVIGLILTDDKMYILVGWFLAAERTHCVLIYSSAYPHQYIKSIISRSEVTNEFHFCMDRYNNIIISDYNACNIKIFSPNGKLLNVIGKKGQKHKGELYYPTGIRTTNRGSIICVNDHDNSRIQIFY